MLSAERLERILGCPCGWRGGPVPCEAPIRRGGQPGGLANAAKKLKVLLQGFGQSPEDDLA